MNSFVPKLIVIFSQGLFVSSAGTRKGAECYSMEQQPEVVEAKVSQDPWDVEVNWEPGRSRKAWKALRP